MVKYVHGVGSQNHSKALCHSQILPERQVQVPVWKSAELIERNPSVHAQLRIGKVVEHLARVTEEVQSTAAVRRVAVSAYTTGARHPSVQRPRERTRWNRAGFVEERAIITVSKDARWRPTVKGPDSRRVP